MTLSMWLLPMLSSSAEIGFSSFSMISCLPFIVCEHLVVPMIFQRTSRLIVSSVSSRPSASRILRTVSLFSTEPIDFTSYKRERVFSNPSSDWHRDREFDNREDRAGFLMLPQRCRLSKFIPGDEAARVRKLHSAI